MSGYLERVNTILQQFTSWTLTNIAREENQCTDALSKLATSKCEGHNPVYFEILEALLNQRQEFLVIDYLKNWRTPIIIYINNTPEPLEKKSKEESITRLAITAFLLTNFIGELSQSLCFYALVQI